MFLQFFKLKMYCKVLGRYQSSFIFNQKLLENFTREYSLSIKSVIIRWMTRFSRWHNFIGDV